MKTQAGNNHDRAWHLHIRKDLLELGRELLLKPVEAPLLLLNVRMSVAHYLGGELV